MTFTAFQDIEGLHNVVKGYRLPYETTRFEVTYAAKVKLHGTNAGYRVDLETGEFKVMKRSGFITPQGDNFGFATWVDANKPELEQWVRMAVDDHAQWVQGITHVEVWGEWVGLGVQKGVALANLDKKIFAPFMVILVVGDDRHKLIEPNMVGMFIPPVHPQIQLIEFEPFLFTFDFIGRQAVIKSEKHITLEALNEKVEEVDKACPWSLKYFGAEGPGEGYVLYPIHIFEQQGPTYSNSITGDFDYSRLMFKAKGEGHKVVKNKAAVIIDPEKVAKFSDFAEKFVTEARCLQGVQAVGGLDIKKMGEFLKWIGNDIIKESEDELEVSGMQWKDVAKSVNGKASNWFKKAVLADLAA